MDPKSKPIVELGDANTLDDGFRAHVNVDEHGRQVNIYGQQIHLGYLRCNILIDRNVVDVSM